MIMLDAILQLVPALRWPTIDAARNGNQEQIAITSCLSTVKSYFPCDTTNPTPNYTCLCEQYLWRVSCFDNHSSFPTSHPDRSPIEITMNDYCRAAGSVGTETIQRNHHRQRRQIGDLLSSIVGDVTAVLSSNGVSIPTSIIESVAGSVVNGLPTPGAADPSSVAAAVTSAIASRTASTAVSTSSTASSASTTGPTSAPAQTTSSATSQDPSSSTTAVAASSSKSSGPSTALIAGVAVGGVIALALIGIFILLLLRHRKKKSRTAAFKDKEASPSSPDTRFPPTNAAYTTLPQNVHEPAHTNAAYSNPSHTNNTYTTLPPSDISDNRNTTMSPVSPLSPSSNNAHLPWASTSTFEDRTLNNTPFSSSLPGGVGSRNERRRSSIPPLYEDEKPATQHQFLDSKLPVGNEMPTTANVWEIDGREVPEPSELGVGDRGSHVHEGEDAKEGIRVGSGEWSGNTGYQAYRPPVREGGRGGLARPPSVENGTSNWSRRNAEGEFLGSRPVGQAL